MKKTRRTSRVGENLRDALVQIFRSDLKGVQLGFSSITDVEVSPDLHYARVYMSGLTEEETKADVAKLQAARGEVRYHLGKRVRMRFTPELDFRYDETTMRASRIEQILHEVMPKQRPEEETEEQAGQPEQQPEQEPDEQS